MTGARSADSIEQEAREKWEAEQAEKLKSLSEEVRIYGIVKGPLKPRCDVFYFSFSCSMSDALRKTARSTTKRCSC